MMADGPGRRLRKNVTNIRRHIDYIANVLNYVEVRKIQFNYLYIILMYLIPETLLTLYHILSGTFVAEWYS